MRDRILPQRTREDSSECQLPTMDSQCYSAARCAQPLCQLCLGYLVYVMLKKELAGGSGEKSGSAVEQLGEFSLLQFELDIRLSCLHVFDT